jgi:hypothetical protein
VQLARVTSGQPRLLQVPELPGQRYYRPRSVRFPS